MASLKSVPVQRLILDENNPRFRRPMAQDEAIAEFSKSPKTRKLAKHICQFGLNPFDPIAATPDPRSNKLIVREGNRRTAALKLLHNPDLAPEAKDEKYFSGLRTEYKGKIPRSAIVAVIDDEKELRRWIRLKHVPDQGGVATLFWQPWEKANFDDGSGPSTKYRNARELVTAALEKDWITEDEHDRLRLSTLSRILDDDEARSLIGFSVDGNGLHTSLGISAQQKLAHKLITDTGRGGSQTSRTLHHTDDLKKYAAQVAAELGIKVDTRAPVTRVGSKPSTSRDAAKKPQTRSRKLPDDVDRKHVVPRGFTAEVSNARALEVLTELRSKIDVNKAPNAAAVLFRIFLEFSVMHYAESPANGIKQKGPKDELKTMVTRVKEDLISKKRIRKQDLAMVNKSLSTPDHFLSISQINQWVHNRFMHPMPREINAAWNGMSVFFAALWADYEQQG